jgi:polyisoprenoid-binding protein YceI
VKKTLYFFVSIATVFSGLGFYVLQDWVLADAYTVKFSNTEVTGTFRKMTSEIAFDPSNLKDSHFDVKLDVASASTGNEEMDKQVTGSDMLNKEKYPIIHFHSTEVEKTASGFNAKGILEMHGVSKAIDIPFTFSQSTFQGTFAISCSAFDMKGMGKGESDKVKIELTVPVKKK